MLLCSIIPAVTILNAQPCDLRNLQCSLFLGRCPYQSKIVILFIPLGMGCWGMNTLVEAQLGATAFRSGYITLLIHRLMSEKLETHWSVCAPTLYNTMKWSPSFTGLLSRFGSCSFVVLHC